MEMLHRHMTLLIDAAYLPAPHLTLVDELRQRFKVGLLSNFDHPPAARALLQQTGLADRLDPILISEEEGLRKPHPTLFRRMLDRARAAAESSVFVGDTPRDDIRGALECGIAAIWIKRGPRAYPDSQPAPTATIEDLAELPSLLP